MAVPLRRLSLLLALVGLGAVYGAAPPAPVAAQPLRLVLPTSNDALYAGDGPSFYQHTDRYFRGRRSQPWEAGQYGFVRNPTETPDGGIVYTRFHEGLDIKPVYRDAAGEPLDTVRAIDEGIVVYANSSARLSNYGKYVVVEHRWSDASFYSLYAHLGEVHVREGQRVGRGMRLGIMGYTGTGINRVRAHLHFEINLLLNRRFQEWHDVHYRRDENPHDLYNGQNLAGLDVAGLFLALRRNPGLRIEDFIARQEVAFTVLVPGREPPDVLALYPWLAPGDAAFSSPPAWRIAFTRSGLPVRIEPAGRRAAEPVVERVDHFEAGFVNHLLTREHGRYVLTRSGRRYLQLLTLGDPAPPPPDMAEAGPSEEAEPARWW